MEGECSRCKKVKKLYSIKDNLCKSCYNYIHINKDRQKEYYKKWLDKHPDYFKNYYLNNKKKKDE